VFYAAACFVVLLEEILQLLGQQEMQQQLGKSF
jgi:hypothetical protein